MSSTPAEYVPDGPDAQRIAAVIPYYRFKSIDRFYDVGGLVGDVEMFQLCIQILTHRYSGMDIDCVGGLDARGFLLGPPLALALKKPFFMLRKKGKMPDVVVGGSYSKEYKGDDAQGEDQLCIQRRAVQQGTRVLLIDDLIATGGTMLAAVELVKGQGGVVVEFACVVELKALKGTQRVQEQHPEIAAWSLISENILTRPGEQE
ncbi:phosphoribosyltransferase-like protein [Tribonema minus]|uniref:adenine phosphoribosyltransferase n=1 Tax=Tribonema minus TaxID=303371 RepID=A0A835ZL34_9STRA|nr:phosphoribosyltransferase-like protein [Tribonema minus]|eukprot:TRINITY_DN6519_c0_g1_i1.p1 TRINITY_DN6519_c0_g1~~TRINITY_DN6519_c0_g1_i1.p1  ORF type:complete len:204 (-),score=69.76 TRINITY_DN6519_c0_g1_i1:332-943(-)